MPSPISPVATLVQHPRDVKNRTNPIPYGLCVHTTGSGVPLQAQKLGIDPLQVAHDFYCNPKNNFPHYVIGNDGTIIQIAEDTESAWHCGVSVAERAAYLDGSWKKKVSPLTVKYWEDKWNESSPSHLYPGKSVNDVYLGVELIPLIKCLPNKSLFTPEQYKALYSLIKDIEKRYFFSQILLGGRLVGHEDVNPLTRSSVSGGWDPGARRKDPSFFWNMVWA